jgi:hypothetical protein
MLSVPEKLRKELLESISNSSPYLKRLTIHQLVPLSLEYTFWPRLKHLSIGRNLATNTIFNNLIHHLGELETLEGCPMYWPNASTPEIRLEKLMTLEVYCHVVHLHRLQFPALFRLSVHDLTGWNTTTPDEIPSISLPVLEALELTTNVHPIWLAALSAPRMRVLTLHEKCTPAAIPLSTFQDNIRFPEVQEFTLQYLCTDQVAISVLECLPNVQKVALSNGGRRWGEPWGLGILQHLAHTDNMLCPRMTKFTLGSLSKRISMNKTLADHCVRQAIKSRSDTGIKMDHFEVHWKVPEESIQYA